MEEILLLLLHRKRSTYQKQYYDNMIAMGGKNVNKGKL